MIYHFLDCVLDSKQHKLYRYGELIEIEPKVFEVLVYLIEQRGELVSRNDLLEACWPGMYISEGSLTRCITRVRGAIAQDKQRKLIETVHRKGYRFIGEVIEHTDDENHKLDSEAKSIPDTSPISPPSPSPPPVETETQAAPSVPKSVPLAQPMPPAQSIEEAPALSTTPVAKPAATPASAFSVAAERRQVTVLSCQRSVDSNKNQTLDVEEAYQQEQQFRQLCMEYLTPLGGYLTQSLANGFVFYFGYPQAFEDGARRAVLSGLRLLQRLQQNQADATASSTQTLQVQIGIHTGPVIVETVENSQSRTPQVAGPTESIATQLGQQAAPQNLLISDATARLVSSQFEYQPVASEKATASVYRVIAESEGDFRFDVETLMKFTPFVGRDPELALLNERWVQTQEGAGQVVLLSGDAGIGKSRLVERLQHQIIGSEYLRLECRSSPYQQNTALFPLLELLRWGLQEQAVVPNASELERLEAMAQCYQLPMDEAVPLLATLLSIALPPQRYPALTMSLQQQHQYNLQLMLTVLLSQAQRQPLLLVIEDLHWADPSTLEFTELLIEQTPMAAMLVVLTARPDFDPPWDRRASMMSLKLDRLNRSQIEQMLWRITEGKPLPAVIVRQIMEKTDGVPLFIEELTHMLLESGQLRATERGFELSTSFDQLSIPPTLQDSLMMRLDHLPAGKLIAQCGAVLGREFSHDLLTAVIGLDATTLQQGLDELRGAELLHQQGLTPHIRYIFKHALIRDVAYQSMLKHQRQQLHHRAAQILQTQFPEITAQQPELLAQHYTEANAWQQAIPFWQKAGERAILRTAMQEALTHFKQGLALLEKLPDTSERQQQELTLQIALGSVISAVKGQATQQVEATYLRAKQLCQQLGEVNQQIPVLWGLWRCYLNRSEAATVRGLAKELFSLAQQTENTGHLLLAHEALGSTAWLCDEFDKAREHFEQGIKLYDREQHHVLAEQNGGCDPGVLCLSRLALALWYLGYPQQALQHSEQARALAQELSQPYSQAFALEHANRLYICLREEEQVRLIAEQQIALAAQQGFDILLNNGGIYQSTMLVVQGQQTTENIIRIQENLAARKALQMGTSLPFWLHLLAIAYHCNGQTSQSLDTFDEAIGLLDQTEFMNILRCDLFVLKGQVLLKQSEQNKNTATQQQAAEHCFQQAYEVAQKRQAKVLELRAATNLAQLWLEQNKPDPAKNLLTPLYDWFSEGFDTVDLKRAKALLERLS